MAFWGFVYFLNIYLTRAFELDASLLFDSTTETRVLCSTRSQTSLLIGGYFSSTLELYDKSTADPSSFSFTFPKTVAKRAGFIAVTSPSKQTNLLYIFDSSENDVVSSLSVSQSNEFIYACVSLEASFTIFSRDGSTVGTITKGSDNVKAVLVKLSLSGNAFVWTRRMEGVTSTTTCQVETFDTMVYLLATVKDYFRMLQVGSVISDVTVTKTGVVMVKLNEAGDVVHTVKMDGHEDERGVDLSVDSESGMILVLVETVSTTFTIFGRFASQTVDIVKQMSGKIMIVAQFSNDAALLWHGVVEASQDVFGSSLALGPKKSIIVAGTVRTDATISYRAMNIAKQDIFKATQSTPADFAFIVKLSENGSLEWLALSASSPDATRYIVASDETYGIYFGGRFHSSLSLYTTSSQTAKEYKLWPESTQHAALLQLSESGIPTLLIRTSDIDSSIETLLALTSGESLFASFTFSTSPLTISHATETYSVTKKSSVASSVLFSYSRVNGKWSSWSPFGQCSAWCPQNRGTRTRTRTCSEPERGGFGCIGAASESLPCDIGCIQVNNFSNKVNLNITNLSSDDYYWVANYTERIGLEAIRVSLTRFETKTTVATTHLEVFSNNTRVGVVLSELNRTVTFPPPLLLIRLSNPSFTTVSFTIDIVAIVNNSLIPSPPPSSQTTLPDLVIYKDPLNEALTISSISFATLSFFVFIYYIYNRYRRKRDPQQHHLRGTRRETRRMPLPLSHLFEGPTRSMSSFELGGVSGTPGPELSEASDVMFAGITGNLMHYLRNESTVVELEEGQEGEKVPTIVQTCVSSQENGVTTLSVPKSSPKYIPMKLSASHNATKLSIMSNNS